MERKYRIYQLSPESYEAKFGHLIKGVAKREDLADLGLSGYGDVEMRLVVNGEETFRATVGRLSEIGLQITLSPEIGSNELGQ